MNETQQCKIWRCSTKSIVVVVVVAENFESATFIDIDFGGEKKRSNPEKKDVIFINIKPELKY